MKVRTDAKRAEILHIASQVFLEMGFGRASMAEIAERVGGSKATLYGYFPSKEQLFVAVATSAGEKHLESALKELETDEEPDPGVALRRFGEQVLTFFVTPSTLATHRMVLAEAGHSEVGSQFYEISFRTAISRIGTFMQAAMKNGYLRRADPTITATHFAALLTAEIQHLLYYRVAPKVTASQLRQMVVRAVDVFLAAYGAPALRRGSRTRAA